MILLLSLAIGVLAGWLTGGRLRNLADVRLRGESGLIALVFATALVPRAFERAGVWWHEPLLAVWAVMMVVIIWLCWMNRAVPGSWFIGAGLLSNLIVVLGNGGMPVSEWAVRTVGGGGAAVTRLAGAAFHLPASSARLELLGDIIPVPGLRMVLSTGDLFMMVGVAVLIAWGMRGGRRMPLEGSGSDR